MSIQYRYFGILIRGYTPDNPAGIVRVWNDESGVRREETYTYRLTWEPSAVLSNTRPTWDELVEIDESMVGPFMERVKKIHGDPNG
jgi:hypothetical protein